jgi:hypothetical protein
LNDEKIREKDKTKEGESILGPWAGSLFSVDQTGLVKKQKIG